MAGDIHVRTATAADELEIRRILDAAMLTFGDLETRLAVGDVLVAGDWQGGSTDSNHTPESEEASPRADERILGTLVLAPVPPETDGCSTGTEGAAETNESIEPARESAHIAAIAVRRRHRGQGIGRALVTCVLESESESESESVPERRVTAHFDADVRPFYESLGFAIEPIEVSQEAGSAELGGHDNATGADQFRGIAVATDDESDIDTGSDTDTDSDTDTNSNTDSDTNTNSNTDSETDSATDR
ncbi:GNAT family N-acetyltransferase [Natrialba hulunbeirensis]|nr:GNAT family N-acetyltransferase [Natrialba hulunbeirensis]